jgi:RNA polymerase sigma-70 factor, ECF subfamily
MDEFTRLAHSARGGDVAALDELIDVTYDRVWRMCAALVDRQSADDLAQETYLRVVRNLPTFRGTSSARTWILAITRHVCLDDLRERTRRRKRDDALAALAETDNRTHGVGDEIEFVDLVCRLDLERRMAFVLTQIVDLSYEETATLCECPIGTVRSRVARARLDLVAAVRGLRFVAKDSDRSNGMSSA